MSVQLLLGPKAAAAQFALKIVLVGVGGEMLLHEHDVGGALAAVLAHVRVLPVVCRHVRQHVVFAAIALPALGADPRFGLAARRHTNHLKC